MTTASFPTFPTIAFLGTGSMNGAILAGLIASGARVDGDIWATNRTREKAKQLAVAYGPLVRSVALADEPEANRRAAAQAGVIVVGVKPYAVGDLLDEISGDVRPGTVVLSVAAGVTVASIAQRLPAGVEVVRAIPNTPSGVRRGVTGVTTDGASDRAAELADGLFATVGRVVHVPEDRLDVLSAVSGSGPAYFYYFVEQLTQAAKQLGFSDEDAAVLVDETFIGAAQLLAAGTRAPSELRVDVTSPGGTTERALAVLAEGGYEQNLKAALDAAIARSRELA